MRAGIICAGDTELAPFLPMISDCKITEKAMKKIERNYKVFGGRMVIGESFITDEGR